MYLLGVKEEMEEKAQLHTTVEGQSRFYCVYCIVLLLFSEDLTTVIYNMFVVV